MPITGSSAYGDSSGYSSGGRNTFSSSYAGSYPYGASSVYSSEGYS